MAQGGGQGKYRTVDYEKREFKLGSASIEELNKLFKGSVAGTLTKKDIIDIAKAYLHPDIQKGNELFPLGVSMKFAGAPDISKGSIKTGPGGLPSTSWSPGLASPGPGSTSPTDMPETDPKLPVLTKNDSKIGVDGLANPKTVSADIGSEELGSAPLTLGKHAAK